MVKILLVGYDPKSSLDERERILNEALQGQHIGTSQIINIETIHRETWQGFRVFYIKHG